MFNDHGSTDGAHAPEVSSAPGSEYEILHLSPRIALKN